MAWKSSKTPNSEANAQMSVSWKIRVADLGWIEPYFKYHVPSLENIKAASVKPGSHFQYSLMWDTTNLRGSGRGKFLFSREFSAIHRLWVECGCTINVSRKQIPNNYIASILYWRWVWYTRWCCSREYYPGLWSKKHLFCVFSTVDYGDEKGMNQNARNSDYNHL